MIDTLRIELTAEERKEWWAGIALEFSVTPEGNVIIYDEYESADEAYGDGISIHIPARIWIEAAPWIAARLTDFQKRAAEAY